VAHRYALTPQIALDRVLRSRYIGIEDCLLTPVQRRRVKHKRANGDANDITPPAGDSESITESEK
jgi:hypothetical protein